MEILKSTIRQCRVCAKITKFLSHNLAGNVVVAEQLVLDVGYDVDNMEKVELRD